MKLAVAIWACVFLHFVWSESVLQMKFSSIKAIHGGGSKCDIPSGYTRPCDFEIYVKPCIRDYEEPHEHRCFNEVGPIFTPEQMNQVSCATAGQSPFCQTIDFITPRNSDVEKMLLHFLRSEKKATKEAALLVQIVVKDREAAAAPDYINLPVRDRLNAAELLINHTVTLFSLAHAQEIDVSCANKEKCLRIEANFSFYSTEKVCEDQGMASFKAFMAGGGGRGSYFDY